MSPNSDILKNVQHWPTAYHGEESEARLFSQGYVLSKDDRLIVVRSSGYHPNLLYSIDLRSGFSDLIGNADVSRSSSIAANSKYVYSVALDDPEIRRAPLGISGKEPQPFIHGPRTRLKRPQDIAVGPRGQLCILENQVLYIRCFASTAEGNASPALSVNMARFGFYLINALAITPGGDLIVEGSLGVPQDDIRGTASIAVVTAQLGTDPKLKRLFTGEQTTLSDPYSLASGPGGSILALQSESGTVLAFGPKQNGNVHPSWTHKVTEVSQPSRLASTTSTVAILGADGIATFHLKENGHSPGWSTPLHVAAGGSGIAFSPSGILVVSDNTGLKGYVLSRPPRLTFGASKGRLSLDDPWFIASDSRGTVYTASAGGAVTAFEPRGAEQIKPLWRRQVRTPFNRQMDAFAADAAGNLYFASASHDAIIVVRRGGWQGILAGPATQLHAPTGLATDPSGDLLVANSGSSNVLIFGAASHGNVAPVAKLAGFWTGLSSPNSIAVNSSGQIFVFDGTLQGFRNAQHNVKVFAADARGNVRPLATYPVTPKCEAGEI
jgi:hypothetical protein